MSNSFNISSAIELAAIEGKVDIIDTVVDNIRAVDVPSLTAEIDANEAKIDIIDTAVDAVKVKTDATPQNVRGKHHVAQLTTQNAAFQEIANVTGHGKVNKIVFNLSDNGVTIEIKLTLDGVAFFTWSHTGDQLSYYLILGPDAQNPTYYLAQKPSSEESPYAFDIEFESSLLLEIRKSAGGAFNVHSKVYYTLDSF